LLLKNEGSEGWEVVMEKVLEFWSNKGCVEEIDEGWGKTTLECDASGTVEVVVVNFDANINKWK
jgi:hypothetical protein